MSSSGKKNKTKKNGRSSPRVVPAAGAVLYRMDGGTPLCAVVHRPRYDDWSLPKGKVDPGESLPVTAVREIAEETGVSAVLRFRIGTTGYPVKENIRKEVTYWAAEALAGEFTPNSEVDELRWLSVEEARELVSYPLDRKILRRFADAPFPGPALMLVRHAKAGDRREWTGDDTLRPLEKAGRTQAEMLAPLLAAFGARRILSAPRLRCEQTMAPFADELGADVEIEPTMSDEAFLEAPQASVSRLLELAAGTPLAVVSSQGTAIPGVVAHLAASSGLEVEDTFTKKAGTWWLGFEGDRLVHADYYRSPLPLL